MKAFFLIIPLLWVLFRTNPAFFVHKTAVVAPRIQLTRACISHSHVCISCSHVCISSSQSCISCISTSFLGRYSERPNIPNMIFTSRCDTAHYKSPFLYRPTIIPNMIPTMKGNIFYVHDLRSHVKSDIRDHVRDHVRSDGRDGEPSILHFPFIYAGFRRSMVGMLGLLQFSFSD